MIERTIPDAERKPFFDSFSRLHRGAIAKLTVGTRDMVASRPFRGISCDHSNLVVHIGDGAEQFHLGHAVPQVDDVRLEQTDEGADAALKMTSNDGTLTVLRFQSPVLPELLEPAVE